MRQKGFNIVWFCVAYAYAPLPTANAALAIGPESVVKM
jgi:hypothetical protein